jgi:hypothetical protein
MIAWAKLPSGVTDATVMLQCNGLGLGCGWKGNLPLDVGRADSPAASRGISTKVLPPYLVEARGVKRCSHCQHPFDADSKPSLSAAFKKHVLDLHRAKQGVGQDRAKTKADRTA